MRAIDADKLRIELNDYMVQGFEELEEVINNQPTLCDVTYDIQKVIKKLDELIFKLTAESTFFTWRIDRRIVRVLLKVEDILRDGGAADEKETKRSPQGSRLNTTADGR